MAPNRSSPTIAPPRAGHVFSDSSSISTSPPVPLLPPDQPRSYSELATDEEIWRDRYSFLLGRGLELRTRYKPGWIPSWLGTNLDPDTCDDSIEKYVGSRGFIGDIIQLTFRISALHGIGC
jgi:hypothetical protein